MLVDRTLHNTGLEILKFITLVLVAKKKRPQNLSATFSEQEPVKNEKSAILKTSGLVSVSKAQQVASNGNSRGASAELWRDQMRVRVRRQRSAIDTSVPRRNCCCYILVILQHVTTCSSSLENWHLTTQQCNTWTQKSLVNNTGWCLVTTKDAWHKKKFPRNTLKYSMNSQQQFIQPVSKTTTSKHFTCEGLR